MIFKARDQSLDFSQAAELMAIINITPDSFSDGGQYFSVQAALKQAKEVEALGVKIVDLGAESTRPKAEVVSLEEEKRRLVPVLKAILAETNLMVSIDTYKAEVAELALDLGAHVINDIYGLLASPKMADIVAKYEAGLILMHHASYYRPEHQGAKVFASPYGLKAASAEFLAEFRGKDILAGQRLYLEKAVARAKAAGIKADHLMIDPGIGFGTIPSEDYSLIKHLDELKSFNLPILLALSRKRCISAAVGEEKRDLGTAAAITYAIAKGADLLRVHDVAYMKDYLELANQIRQAD